MRKDPHGNPLPPRIYYKSGRYYYVRGNRWHTLSRDYTTALIQRARLESPSGDWAKLVELVYERYHRRCVAGELSAATVRGYGHVRARIEYAFSEFQPDQITTRDVVAFLDHYEDMPAVANRMLAVLRAIFDRAVRRGQCDYNPAQGIKPYRVKARDRYITDAEYVALRQAANPTMQLIMDICYLTGQRISDVLAIRLADITADGIAFRQKKTRQRLQVSMTTELAGVIEDARRLHKVTALYLFHPRGRGTPYTYSTVRKFFDRAKEKAGITDVTIHDLRAKSITDAKKAGHDPQALAGHRSAAMTERYIRLRETIAASGPGLVKLKNGV